MTITDSTIYVVDTYEGRQIDPSVISVSEGVVTAVTDTQGDTYLGERVAIITPRDFVYVADLDIQLTVGDEIYLDNQSRQKWTVRQGWYSVDGNPAIYGWYLESIPVGQVRSLYLKDLDHLTVATTQFQISGSVAEG